ncbi:MAG: hypothetical protein U0326_04470 [Polyangiales bacterium]
MSPPPDPDALSRQSVWMPPLPPDTSTVPAMVTAPVARRSSTPVPVVVTVTPAGTLIVVKLCTPGVSTVLVVGENAPSVPVDGKRTQPPATHGVPVGQTVPHAPQWLGSVAVLMQVVPQLVSPGPHEAPQTDARHAGEPPVTAGQTLPQPPQLLASVRVSTQALEHTVSPTAQKSRHVPATQA